jgi:hypothetical protein
VEPGEIEAALCRIPGVAQAAVVAVGEQLHAYVVLDGDLDASQLRRALSGWLPDYMCPSRFVAVEALPLNASGKIDRRALPNAGGERLTSAEYQAPDTTTAKKVAEVWRNVLDVARVGLHDSFFDLGGHSMLILQVQKELGAVLNRTPSVIDLFQYPTVAALSAHLDGGVSPVAGDAEQRARERRAGRDRLRRRRENRDD